MAELGKRMKGSGRVAFIAHRDTIATDLEAGWPMKAVYERLAGDLGISYPQFVRYVYALVRPPGQSVAPKTTPKPRTATASPPAAVAAAPQPTEPAPPATEEGSTDHARHKPAPRRAFNHDALERPDDRKRLLGEQ